MPRFGSIVISSTCRTQNGAIRSWLRSSSNCAKASRAEKLTARTRNGQPRSFSTRSMLERCRRCVRLFLRPTTAQLTGLRCCNPEASSLLDVQTLMAVRNDESVIRWGLGRMAWYQKLSDELIVPNLDQDISFFYDPATKKLRKRFEIYPDALQATVKFANELERTCSNEYKPSASETANHAPSSCHSEPSEESQIISGPLLMELNQRCFASLNMTRSSKDEV